METVEGTPEIPPLRGFASSASVLIGFLNYFVVLYGFFRRADGDLGGLVHQTGHG